MRVPILLLLFFACPSGAAAAAPPPFDPIAFFAGRTEGAGDMKILLHATRHIRVHGRGVMQGDGSIVLDQTVDGAGKTPEHREWRLRKTSPGHYAGTLSDARAPVVADADGDTFHLSYESKSGFAIEQWMTPAPDRRSVANRLVARKAGFVVARLNETIRKAE